MDVVALHQAGFVNAVATLGTSLTAEQARMISQYAEEPDFPAGALFVNFLETEN